MPLLRRIPKRGFNSPEHVTYNVINVAVLEEAFADGAVVDMAALQEQGLVRKALDGVKILGDGALTRKLTVKVQAFSASAKAKIEAAGGTCEQL